MSADASDKLLIVDDEADLRDLFSLALADLGLSISVASSGREAIALLSRERFLGVLSDVRMPNGSGLTVLDHVMRQPHDQRPFVILSSGFADLAPDEALARGAVALLPKPIDLDVLIETVASAARRRRGEG